MTTTYKIVGMHRIKNTRWLATKQHRARATQATQTYLLNVGRHFLIENTSRMLEVVDNVLFWTNGREFHALKRNKILPVHRR